VHKQWHHGGYKTLYIVKDMQGSPKQIARGANKEVAERIAYLLNTYGK